MGIGINLEKAKSIAHSIRRVSRSEEFAPLDIKTTIPSEAALAESQRQLIRGKYVEIQNNIDTAKSLEEINEALIPIARRL
jgi:hypothetical protein